MLSIEGNFGRTLPTGSASQSNIYDRLFSSPLRGDLLLLLLLLLFLKETIRIRGFFQYCSRFGRIVVRTSTLSLSSEIRKYRGGGGGGEKNGESCAI